MVGHDGERVHLNVCVVPRNATPVFMRDPPVRVHNDPAIRGRPEPWLAILRAERHEIQTGRCVIVRALADTAAMVAFRIECAWAMHDVENSGLNECLLMRAT